MKVYIFTLDAHDYIGPFSRENAAHMYAKKYGYSTYQLISNLPWGVHIIKPIT